MRKIAVMYGGSYQNKRTYKDSHYAQYFDAIIPQRQLATADLEEYDVLIIPSWSHMKILEQNIDKIRAFADAGKIVVTFGPQHIDWLPNCKWENRHTNFWWWLDPAQDSGLHLPKQSCELFAKYLKLEDATWHQHGIYHPSKESEVLVAHEDGAAALYIDKTSSKGTWICMTLDPDFHYGMHFMPACERFLNGFFPWLKSGNI